MITPKLIIAVILALSASVCQADTFLLCKDGFRVFVDPQGSKRFELERFAVRADELKIQIISDSAVLNHINKLIPERHVYGGDNSLFGTRYFEGSVSWDGIRTLEIIMHGMQNISVAYANCEP